MKCFFVHVIRITQIRTANMPIDINDNRQIHRIWYKYKGILDEHTRSRSRHWKNNTLDEWEKVYRGFESQRRKEISQVQKIVKAERAEIEEKDRQLREQKEEERKIVLLTRRKNRLERKNAQKLSPPPLRRSARIQKQNLQ